MFLLFMSSLGNVVSKYIQMEVTFWDSMVVALLY